MSKDSKIEFIDESKTKDKKAMEAEIEMVFGTPSSPKTHSGADLIDTERNQPMPGTHQKRGNHGDIDTVPSEPLLGPAGGIRIPLVGPESDELDDEKHPDAAPFPGLHPPGKEHEGENGVAHNQGGSYSDDDHPLSELDGEDATDGWPLDPHYPDGLGSRFGDDRPGSPGAIALSMVQSLPDVNTYQQKKNLAQGMMDIALFTANANQLRYVLESSTSHPYYILSLSLIGMSIFFQIAVGVGLILNSRYNVKHDKDMAKADKINNLTVLGVFMITIVNVFITAFSVATPNSVAAAVQTGN